MLEPLLIVKVALNSVMASARRTVFPLIKIRIASGDEQVTRNLFPTLKKLDDAFVNLGTCWEAGSCVVPPPVEFPDEELEPLWLDGAGAVTTAPKKPRL